jgi:hypothetical protein
MKGRKEGRKERHVKWYKKAEAVIRTGRVQIMHIKNFTLLEPNTTPTF